MRRTVPTTTTVAIALAALACPGPPRTPYDGPARHVVLITLDTTRADHLGFYGNPWIRTPELDALAAESIVFDRCLTAATTTLASHTSLMTGKYPQSHGVPRNGFVVNPDNVTFAEILRDAGFRTAGFLGSFALESRFRFNQGFEHYDESFDLLAGPGMDQNQRTAGAVNDAVAAWLDREGVPPHLFLFVHFFDPHMPYAPPAPYDAMYGDDEIEGAVRVTAHPAFPRDARPGADFRRMVYRYAGEISYTDSQVGRLLAGLRRRGILDDALVVVASDHGENLGEPWSPPFDHGWTVRESESRCVALIRLPRGEAGGRRHAGLVSSVDLLPSVTGYLGLPVPDDVDGEVLDLVRLPEPERPPVRFSEATKPWTEVETDPRWINVRKPRTAVRDGYQYVEIAFRDERALYDLSVDPLQRTDLLDAPTLETEVIATELAGELGRFTAAAHPLASRFDPSQWEETVERLRALGYLGGPGGDAGGGAGEGP